MQRNCKLIRSLIKSQSKAGGESDTTEECGFHWGPTFWWMFNRCCVRPWVHFSELCGTFPIWSVASLLALNSGQSDLTATNAPVGRSVHWMGCVFSFGAGWGSSQSISFFCWPLYFSFVFFSFWFLVVFSGPDLTHSYPAHFPTDTATLISNYPTDLAIVLTTYPTNLATLLITYLTNLTIRFRVETQIN